MIQINKQGNAIVIEFTDNDKYLFNGIIEIAPNELMVVVDESNMATFKRVSNGDTLFALNVENILINGITATKDTVIDLFGSIGYTSGGGGGTGAVSSVNGQTGDVVITAAGIGAMTKAQADAVYQTKDESLTELEEKLEVFQVNAPMAFTRDEATQDLHLSIDLTGYATKEELNNKADSATVEALSTEVATQSTNITNLTSKVNEDSDKVASLDTEMGNKQDTLVSGTNIKTINNLSILGEGNILITGSTVDSELSATSENPVQNKVINTALNTKVDKVEGKSLVSDTDITKLEELKPLSEIDTVLANKQDTLISGTNIKTINGNSLLGEGNIDIQGAITVDSELSTESENPVQNKVITAALNSKQAAGDYALKSDTATKTEVNTLSQEVEHKADKTSVYTMDEVNTKLATKQATLIAGANITLSDPDSEGKVTIAATQPDISGITTTIEELTGEVATLSTDKQDKLVSGTNIKTINGESILGTGNIEISGGVVDTAMSDTSENAVQNKVIKAYIDNIVGNILTKLQEINGNNQ